ncbi:MAG: serine/threonine protein kinase, partial [Clostridiales bacterium]|nr:serine/threonine protein kinase [Clostridiales bacterium]
PMDNNKKCIICGYVPQSQVKCNCCLPEGYEINDRYTIGTVKGSGGFANTYIGYDKYFSKKVAIKEFLPSEFVSRTDKNLKLSIKSKKHKKAFKTGKKKFLNETRILQNLTDVKGAVNVEGFFRANNTAYMVMELIEGETLEDYLKRQPQGKLTPTEGFKLLRPIFDIIQQVHAHGLIHRDISPGNIIVTKEKTAKLIDFGASHDMMKDNNSKAVIVKEGYTPPEQYTNRGKQGPWTDIYSLAATIYKTVTGITPPDPFKRMMGEKIKTAGELGLKVTNEKPLFKALELNIDDRYHSVKEFIEDLNRPEGVKPKTQTVDLKLKTSP